MFPFHDARRAEQAEREMWEAHSEVDRLIKRIADLEDALRNTDTHEFEWRIVAKLKEELAHTQEERDHWKQQYEKLAQN
jgi:hypothetical protein